MANVGWLHRRAGFGLHPDAYAAATERGVDVELERMLAPDAAGIERVDDPWAELALDPEQDGRREAVVGWVRHLLATDRPFEDRRAWMLHGWLVSSMAKVTIPSFMVEQIELFRSAGGGSYPDLLKAVTTNRAMLVYLDGRTSTGEAPNENYARELMELFALGVGNYTEDDVKAASAALTGWVAGPNLPEARFVPRRHDSRTVTLLGVDGVTDVDSVVGAVVAHPAHAEFVAARVATEYLGDPAAPELDGVVGQLARFYDDHDRLLDPLIGEALRLGLDGASTPLVVAPVPWLIGAARSLGVTSPRFERAVQSNIRELGQLPMLPPGVDGWPRGVEWFTASSLIARTNVAFALASATVEGEPIRVATEEGDLDLVARHLGLDEPFLPSTASALRAETDPVGRLTLALVSPENLLS